MDWNELTDMEKLAYMQEAYSRLGEELRVNGSGIMGRLDREFVEMYKNPNTRCKSRDVIVNDTKVGTYSLSVSKEKPAYSQREFSVTDPETLEANDDFDFRSWVSGWVERNIQALAEEYFNETGELIDGCDLVEVEYPATPPHIGHTTLKLDHKAFGKAIGEALPEAISGFLGEAR